MAFVPLIPVPVEAGRPVGPNTDTAGRVPVSEARAAAVGIVSVAIGWLWLKAWPGVELGWFAGGSAWLAGLFTGAPVSRVATGWLLPVTGQPVVVTTACSATDYFLIVSALISRLIARRGKTPGCAVVIGLVAGLPLTVFLNALRVVVVTHAHRWLIPLLPESCGPFLHMLTGVAIFLPGLVLLNLLLESYGNTRSAARA